MKFTKVIRFEADGIAVDFRPVADVPGFSHKVLILRGRDIIAKDWLGDHAAPSAKMAAFYCEKHAAKIAA